MNQTSLLKGIGHERYGISACPDHFGQYFLGYDKAIAATEIANAQQTARKTTFHGMESIAGHRLLGLGKQGLAMTNEDGAHCYALIESCLETFHIEHRGGAIQQDGCFIDRIRVTKRGKCA